MGTVIHAGLKPQYETKHPATRRDFFIPPQCAQMGQSFIFEMFKIPAHIPEKVARPFGTVRHS